jgi:hypothetical protein
VTTPGQTVALLLDKSKGLVLGSELVTNGNFSNGTTGWSSGSGAVLSDDAGRLKVTLAGSQGWAAQSISTVIGASYRVDFTVTNGDATGVYLFIGTANNNTAENYDSGAKANGTYTAIFRATATTTFIKPFVLGSAGKFAFYDNISVKELPGNHATQATTASRPTYGIQPLGGRRNLLTRTEEFGDADWVKSGSPTLTSQGGGVWRLQASAGSWLLYQARPLSGNVAFSIEVKSNGAGLDGFMFMRGGVAVGSNLTATSDWVRYTTTGTNTGSGDIGIIRNSSLAAVDVLIRFPQLELGSTATAYQRVTTQYDVTEAGVQSLSYLSFDGVDDFLVTPTITPGIDKVQVFVGVRKLSDAAAGVIVEHSANSNTNTGSLAFFAPSGASPNYGWRSYGNGAVGDVTSTTYTAPITSVLTGQGSIATDLSTLRINGTQVGSSSADQGTGNFGNYPLYLGRRGGTSAPFNGQIYNLIVRFGANLDAGAITSTETFVAGKTGVTL